MEAALVTRPLTALAMVVVLVAGCAGTQPDPTPKPRSDKLDEVLARGTLLGYAELDYPPQSIRVDGGQRPADTRCASDQLTEPEVTGFDIETTKLVARELGVEACFVHQPISTVTAAGWADVLDIAYASASINADRMQRLWMTQPYYAVPNVYFVATDAPFQRPEDLNGLRIGACAGCSHELFLRGELAIPGVELRLTIDDLAIVTYETEGPGLRAVARGELDAFLAAEPVGQALIEEGLAIRALETPAFTYYPTGLVDRSSSFDVGSFVEHVNEIIAAAHADGTLRDLSEQWFGTDYASAAGAFDLTSIGQQLP
jgi:polar amino acid transport system substrate-binding protein